MADDNDARVARLEQAMTDLATAMTETRADIRRLYEAWPVQMRTIHEAAETVRRRSSEADQALIHELGRIYSALERIETRLQGDER